MRRGKSYRQFPCFGYAPNGWEYYGVPYVCTWSIYLLADTLNHDDIVTIRNADLEVDVATATCRWRGDDTHGGRTWAARFWTRVLPTSPDVEIGVHLSSSDGLVVDVRAPRLLSDIPLWTPGGSFIELDPGESNVPAPFIFADYLTAQPTKRFEEP